MDSEEKDGLTIIEIPREHGEMIIRLHKATGDLNEMVRDVVAALDVLMPTVAYELENNGYTTEDADALTLWYALLFAVGHPDEWAANVKAIMFDASTGTCPEGAERKGRWCTWCNEDSNVPKEGDPQALQAVMHDVLDKYTKSRPLSEYLPDA
jgi:hypothetical protein